MLYTVIGVVCALVIAGIVVLVVVLVRKQQARAAAASAGQVVVVDPSLLATQPLDGTGEVYLVPLDQVTTVAPASVAPGDGGYIVQQQ